MCCTRLTGNAGPKNSPKIAIWAPSHNFVGYIFATKAHIDNRKKKLVKQQYLLHMSLQYGELRRTSGWDRFVSLGHPCKCQWVSRLGSVTAQHSSIGHQPNFRWTESGTYVRQGGHDVGHWSTFLVNINSTYIIWWWGLIIVIIYLRPFSQCKIQGRLCYLYLEIFMQSLSLLSCSCYLS